MATAQQQPGTRIDAAQETDPIEIQVKSQQGKIETISAQEFQKRFGVEYASQLIFAQDVSLLSPREESGDSIPEEWQRAALKRYFGQFMARKQVNREEDQALKKWLYAEEIHGACTANMYLAHVNDTVGYGVFAGANIEPGELIGEYTGLVRSNQGCIENPYLFGYDHRNCVDAEKYGNLTRFINHSGRRANAHSVYVVVDGVWHVLLVAMETIARDQQILFDYGLQYWRGLPRPIELG